MDQKIIDILNKMEYVTNNLKSTFVAKDELVELLVISAIAQEHLLIVGPPGTAKSDLIKRFALFCTSNDMAADKNTIGYFEYLLTRFTEPNEIFGNINISAFKEGLKGSGRRVTDEMLPRAEIIFLDEVFKANSAILNALLTILNERIFYNAGIQEKVPNIFTIGATNAVPDDDELAALYDRFLLRIWTDNVEETLFDDLFQKGWKLEQHRIARGHGMLIDNILTTEELRILHQELENIDISPIKQSYREVIRQIRSEGIQLSDRRLVKLLKLIAASALRHQRTQANPGDFWVLRHVWNSPEQIPHLIDIVDPDYVTPHEGDTWRSERLLTDIQDDIHLLESRQADLRTDTDYSAHLTQLETLRKELIRHSAALDNASQDDKDMHQQLKERITQMVDQMIQLMDDQY